MIKENKELMTEARECLNGRWKNPIMVILAYSAIFIVLAIIPIIGNIGAFLLQGIMIYGVMKYFMGFNKGELPEIKIIFDGFEIAPKLILTNFLISLYTMLWSLLLFVPGVIKAISYSQVYFILNDDSTLSASEAIKRSQIIMDGHKWKYFCLTFRFMGWWILASMTIGIGFVFLIPYMVSSFTNFYEDIKENNLHERIED